MTRPLRVVVADDHPVFRDGLQEALDDEPDITVVAAVADGDAAVAETLRGAADVVLSVHGAFHPRAGSPIVGTWTRM